MTNLFYNEMTPNEQKICFQGLAQVFLAPPMSFRNFYLNFDILVEISVKFWSQMA